MADSTARKMDDGLPPAQPARQEGSGAAMHHRRGVHSRRRRLKKLLRRLLIAIFVFLVVLACLYVWMTGLRD